MIKISFKDEIDSETECSCFFCRTISKRLPPTTNIEYLVSLCPKETEISFSFLHEITPIASALNASKIDLNLERLCIKTIFDYNPTILAHLRELPIPITLKHEFCLFDEYQFEDFNDLAYLSNFILLLRHHIGMYIDIYELP